MHCSYLAERFVRRSVMTFLFVTAVLHSASPVHAEVTEKQCEEYLAKLRKLGAEGCDEEFRSTLNECGVAAGTLLACVVVPEPAEKIGACLAAAFQTKECLDRKHALDVCELNKRLFSEELAKIADGDCVAFVNGDGCSIICVKRNGAASFLGVIDPTRTRIKDAIRFFEKR